MPGQLQAFQWLYPQSLFPALTWYWSKVAFEDNPDKYSKGTTWTELAIDVQHSTHEGLDFQEPNDATLDRRARFFASATVQMMKLCKTNIMGNSYKRTSNAKSLALTALSFSILPGLPRRAKFLCHDLTMETLYRTAVEAAETQTKGAKAYSLKIKPRMENAKTPLWTSRAAIEQQTLRRRIRGKRTFKQMTDGTTAETLIAEASKRKRER